MKATFNAAFDVKAALFSGDEALQNKAYRALYMSGKIQAKVQDWANYYNLRDKQPEDVLQEAMVLLFDAVENSRFRGECQAETFLLGICKNLIRDSGKRVRYVVFKESITDADLTADAVADQLVLSERTEEEEQKEQALREAMNGLTDKCREALKKYYFENKNMDTIAQEAQLANREQAKKAVHRCRESLRSLLSGYPIFKNV
jgi:RNA polymerase sigma factor (sigma-70 family)